MSFLNKLPPKYSKSWIWIFAIYFFSVFIIFILTQLILKTNLNITLVLGLLFISLICSFLSSAGGFIGGKWFFLLSTVGSAFGLLYMLFIVTLNISDGWSDIVGILSFAVYYCFASAAGIIAEGVNYIYLKQKHIEE